MEETTYEKLPYFSDKFKEVLLPPKKGETTGEYINITIDDINTYPQLSAFKDQKTGADKFEYWTTIEFDGVKYSWKVSAAILKALLKTGIKKSELPITIQLASYSEIKNGELKKGYNSKCEGHRGDWKASLEELISAFNGTNNNQQHMQQQAQQTFQPHLVPTRDYEKERKDNQQNIMIGMAINIGSDDFRATKSKKTRVELIQEAFNDITEAKKLIEAKLAQPEEIIKGIDFPVDEADMDEIDEIFGTK